MRIDLIDAIDNQDLGIEYLVFQSVPVAGAILSVPFSFYCGCQIINHLVKAIIASISHKIESRSEASKDKPQYTPEQLEEKWQNVVDYSVLFFNQLANILTAGLLNSGIATYKMYCV
jgi:hypothetical protein